MSQEKNVGKIIKVSGPLVVASGMENAKMFEVVRVSEQRLVGEIIKLKGDTASIQVYEETSGIGPGEPVYLTGKPLTVELGPGLLESIYDGVQRPLDKIYKQAGDYITRGIDVPGLDREKEWGFHPKVKVGDNVAPGDVIGVVQETSLIEHKIMVLFNVSGTIESIVAQGSYKITDEIAKIKPKTQNLEPITLTMMQNWPIREPRPIFKKLIPSEPLICGQRVLDAFFPVVKGGTACVPGPFGAGKTVIQHQLAKWADADIVIFIGCGERGNEMTDVLQEFPELKDPKSGQALMKRTVLIANTSNMPVAAREASVYTGITIAEYFRDMGYKVLLTADSTSRWAEAMREISGRLEEMPGEEGYPAYLGSKTAAFYERAGACRCLGSDNREGSLTVVGAVSPPGGDLSEPVTQNTLRVTKVFWGLDANLAYKRHFPSINWLTSYSLYFDKINDFMRKNAGEDWPEMREKAMGILQKEAELEEIVRLVGIESLSQEEQLLLDTAKSIREDFLHQNAFDDVDTFTSVKKMYLMLKAILEFQNMTLKKLKPAQGGSASGKEDIKLDDILKSPFKEKIAKAKMVPEDKIDELEKLVEEIGRQ